MKDFETALHEVMSDIGRLTENLNSLVDGRMDNREFVGMIHSRVAALSSSVQNGHDDPVEMIAILCASLHAAFDMGMLVGMAMERQDLPDL